MKHAFKITALLLAGLALNVLVASWCDARVHGWISLAPRVFNADQTLKPNAWCLAHLDSKATLSGEEYRSFGYSAHWYSSFNLENMRGASEVETGWPLRAFRARYAKTTNMNRVPAMVGDKQFTPFLSVEPSYWIKDKYPWQCRALLMPVWLGIAVNTAFYAAVVWGVAMAVQRMRRWVLAKLRPGYNLCPACAYSLAGLASGATVCPECGGPVQPAAAKSGSAQQVPEAQ